MDEIKLRPYQEEAEDDIREKFKQGKKWVVLCMPTGAGKTVTFASMVAKTLKRNPESIIYILTHRKELLKQGGGTLEKFGISPFYVDAKTKQSSHWHDKSVFVGMVESLKKRREYLPTPTLLIIDEAHIGNFSKVKDWWPCVHCVGATATPIATSKEKPLKSYFDDIVVPVQVHDLIAADYLSSPILFSSDAADLSGLEKDAKKGDYTEKSQFEAFSAIGVVKSLLTNLEMHAKGEKTLVFCSNIAHTEQVTKHLREGGFDARCLHSMQEDKTGENRADTIKWFAQTENAILVNCGILTAGFDEPTIKNVVLLRATTSLALYMQMVGRGSRICEGKSIFKIMDFGQNWERLQAWNAPRDWEHIFFNPEKKGDGVAPMKECKECGALNALKAAACFSCDAPFEKPQEEKDKKEEELIILKLAYGLESNELARKIYDRAKELKELKGDEKAVSLREFSREVYAEKGRAALGRLAEMMGYKNGWAFARKAQIELLENQDFTDIADNFAKTKDEAILNQVFDAHGKSGFAAMAEHLGYKPGWAFVQEQKQKGITLF